MREHDSPFGGELAGHFYYRRNYTADSSIGTVIEVLNHLRETGKPLSELVAPLKGWEVKSSEVWLDRFDFAKIAMYQDLVAHEPPGEGDGVDDRPGERSGLERRAGRRRRLIADA